MPTYNQDLLLYEQPYFKASVWSLLDWHCPIQPHTGLQQSKYGTTRALYMLIKVSRGTEALARLRIARPADTFLTIWSIWECHVKVLLSSISTLWFLLYHLIANLFLHQIDDLDERSCFEWQYWNFGFLHIKIISLFAWSQDWILFRSLFSFICRSVGSWEVRVRQES